MTTLKQASRELKPYEMPECAGNPGAPCSGPPPPAVIKGYDDRFRCPACNAVHVELVMEEAGESAPGATQPQFVAPKLDAAAKLKELGRRRRIERMMGALEDGRVDPHTGRKIGGQIRGPRGIPEDNLNMAEITEGDYRDMLDAQRRGGGGTQEPGISDEERRNRILAKYGVRS